MDGLDELRKQIDACDRQLVKLFAERLELVDQVARYKLENSQPIYHPEREQAILQRYSGDLRQLFKYILQVSRGRQARQLFPYNIVLIGFMGAGKTTVGKELATQLGRTFVDLDRVIEAEANAAISTIFQQFGEDRFRQLEEMAVKEHSMRRDIVLACGGGVVLNNRNIDLLRKNGIVVLLEVQPATVLDRLKGNLDRPILQGMMDLENIKGLMAQRAEAYAHAADISVSTDNRTIQQVAEEITRLLLGHARRDL